MAVLKASFSYSPKIYSCLDAVYWGGWLSVFLLLNASILFMTKQMSKDTMLTCSGYFLICLWSCLTGTRETKDIDFSGFWVGGACAGAIYVKGACTEGTYFGGTYISNSYVRTSCLRGVSVRSTYSVGTIKH